MALTGKTIGQLTYLSEVTNDTLFPVELSGDTYHINYSAITTDLMVEVPYSELVDKITGETLNAGSYYIITDFRTCYDQPDFNYNNNSITGVSTYHVSDIDQIIVLATSENTISTTAYQPTYPNDRIQYDWTFSVTEVTGGVAYGRITERIDEYGNITDYDHRTVLFKRYKSYFQVNTIQGRIIEMNNGVVIGLGTNFNSLSIGSIIMILSQNPLLYEVITISSSTIMTVAGFGYQNFIDPVGFECKIMDSSGLNPINGSLYYFNDVGIDVINDGGDDMYDYGNVINTDLFNQIPYTHTQMTDPPVNVYSQALFSDFVYDGVVESGDTYFNSGSSYFTNVYPGLFVMTSYDVTITNFEINGNLGADSDGEVDTYDYTLTLSGNDYSVYSKRVWGAQDPSVSHIYIVNTIDENIVHTISMDTDNDTDTISNLSAITQVHYLLFALAGGIKPTNIQINNVVNSYLSLIDTSDINVTLTNLNSNFTGITSNLPANNSEYKSLNYKQTNLTGDTESFTEHLTFLNLSDNKINNYIGNYANTFESDNNPFILSNNIFYGNFEYKNNTFGYSCFNNTFDDDCSNNIIGNFFYNNTTDDDFDDNLIGNHFNNNYITSNFRKNIIGNHFNNNTIINNSMDNNTIGNYFENNVIINDDFNNNKILNTYNNNIIFTNFYLNNIDSSFYNNKIYSMFQSNLIGEEFYSNSIYSALYANTINKSFNNNTIGPSSIFGSFSFNDNKIGIFCSGNNIISNFANNDINNFFQSNTLSGNCNANTIKSYFQNNAISGVFSYNQIGNNFYNNVIGDGFGYGINTSQGNIIGNHFYSNTIGEYFYNNVISDGFCSNTIVDSFQLNNIKFSLSSTDFSLSTYVYGVYNCTLFKNSDFVYRLSYYNGFDVLNIVDVTD